MRVTLVVLASALAAAPAVAFAAPTPVTVYLERGGQTVTTRGGDEVEIPRFGGGDRTWTQLVACVKDRFAPFQVTITDRNPGRGEHITALVGGKALMIGLSDRTTNGIGPYSGEVIENATVHVFSQVGTGERDVDNLCAVTAHEVGHSLGLDHSHLCGDVMSYYNDECGTQQFLDAEAPCGETEDRACGNGDETQNSYWRLASLVGLRTDAPRSGPKPTGAAPADDSLDVDDSADAGDSSVDVGDDASDDSSWSDDDAAAIDDATDSADADDATTAPDTSGTTNAFSDDGGDADDDDSDEVETAPAMPAEEAPAEPTDSADEPEQPAPRWNGRRGGWRDGRRGRWQRTESERPHCGE